MDKSDVEMDDAENKAQDVENTVVESETKTLDSSEGVDIDGRQSTESAVEYNDCAKTERGDQSNVPAENRDEGKKNACNFLEDRGNGSDEKEGQGDSKGVVEDICDGKSNVDDQRNAASGTVNQHDTISQLEKQGTATAVDQNVSEIGSLGQNNAKGDTEDTITGGKEAESKTENREGEVDADVATKNEEPTATAAENDTRGGKVQLPEKLSTNEVGESEKGVMKEVHEAENPINEVHQNGNDVMVDKQKEVQHRENSGATGTVISDGDARLDDLPEAKDVNNTAAAKMPEPATPNLPVKSSTAKAGQHTEMADDEDEDEDDDENDDESPEHQAAFMRELESFYRERAMEFKPPRFYGQPLNCLKLWRSVIRLGGYDRVTGAKLWRQVGESFNPPKTCTTVSWTFRIFYEKALLEYERHKRQSGELQLPIPALPDSSGVDNEGNGYQASVSGRARRDAAARAMQGWHEQRFFGYGEVGEPIIKDKNANSVPKREKNLKSIGSLKQKRPNEVERPVKAARTETSKQLVTTVVDLGPPADWVKINVRESKDCFEVYALVPGLLREEVRVQSDPAGRLVITGQPEQLDNPWGITAFKKVVNLPARIDPLQTSAVVSLHGRLYVRVPFAQ